MSSFDKQISLTQFATVDSVNESISDIAGDLWASFKSSVTQPLRAMAEVSDRSIGSNFEQCLHVDGPVQANFGTGRFWAQQVGNAAGMLPWFLAVHKGVGAGMSKTLGKEAMRGAAATELELLRTAGSGFIFGSALTTSGVGSETDTLGFIGRKAANGLHAAASFTLMEGAGMVVGGKYGGRVSEKIGASFLGGLLGGAADAELHALRDGRLLPSKEELGRSMVTFGVLGAGMTAAHTLVPRLKETPAFGERRTSPVAPAAEPQRAIEANPASMPHEGRATSPQVRAPGRLVAEPIKLTGSEGLPGEVRPSSMGTTVAEATAGGRIEPSLNVSQPVGRIEASQSGATESTGGTLGFGRSGRARSADGTSIVIEGMSVPEGARAVEPTFADTFNDTALKLAQPRQLAQRIANFDGVGIRRSTDGQFQITYAANGDITSLTIPRGAQAAQVSEVIATASYARLIAEDAAALESVSRVVKPGPGFLPREVEVTADWATTQRLALEGSRSYVNGEAGNAYTRYLRERFGEFTAADRSVLGDVISQAAERFVAPDSLVSSGILIESSQGALQNPVVATMRPGARKAAVRALLRAAELDPRMTGLDPGSPEGSVRLGEIARNMPADLVEAAIGIDAVAASKTTFGPGELETVSSLAREVGQPAQTVYEQMNILAGRVAERITNMPELASARNLEHVRTTLERQYVNEPGRAAQVYDQVLHETANRLRMTQEAGLGRHVLQPSFGDELGVFLNRSGGTTADTTLAALRSARAVTQNRGSAGFRADVADAVLRYEQGAGTRQWSPDQIVVVEVLANSGVQHPTRLMVEVAENLGVHHSQSGQHGARLRDTVESVTTAVASGDIPAVHARTVQTLLEAGIPVTRQTVEVANRLALDPAGLDSGILRAASRLVTEYMTPGEAHQITVNFVNEVARSSGVTGDTSLAGTVRAIQQVNPRFDTAQIVDTVQSIQRTGGFDGAQLADPAVFEAAFNAHMFLPTQAPTRLQSISLASRIHGREAVSNPDVLSVYDAMLEAGNSPTSITLADYHAANALLNRKTAAGIAADRGPQPTADTLYLIRRDARFQPQAGSNSSFSDWLWENLLNGQA